MTIGGVATASARRVDEGDRIIRQLMEDRDSWRDPYPLYRELASLGPVHRSDLDGHWYVTGYDAMRPALLDARIGKPPGTTYRFGFNAKQIVRTNQLRRPSMIFANGGGHRRMRLPARGPFSPKKMADFRATVRSVVDERLDEAAESSSSPPPTGTRATSRIPIGSS